MKTTDLLQLLASEYPAPAGAFIPEFRAGTGYGRESRADAIAMRIWPSAKDGLELTGFELKISRSDWLREIKEWNRDKATPIKRFCDRWWVVAANVNIVKYADELPTGWGLMFVENGKLIRFIEAPKLEPDPIDRIFLASIMRRATRVDGLLHIVPPNNDWGKK